LLSFIARVGCFLNCFKKTNMLPTVFKWPITSLSKATSRQECDNLFNDNRPSDTLHSDSFVINGSDMQFVIRLDKKSEAGTPDFCALYLEFWDSEEEENSMTVQFKLWVENCHGKTIPKQPQVMVHEFNDGNVCSGFDDFMHSDQLDSSTSDFVINDSIIICCEALKVLPTKPDMFAYTAFHEKLFLLHEQGITGDCVLQVGGKKFTVAKNVLMANSEVFERIFASKSNGIKIDGVRIEVLEKFIKYMYLRAFSTDMEVVAEELFALSSRYAVDTLKDDCANFLIKTLSKENIGRRLLLALTHNSNVLKKGALFYATGFGSEDVVIHIFQSKEWKELVAKNKPSIENTTTISKICSWF